MNETPSWMQAQSDDPAALAGIDTSLAHPARIYDYWLGGKDNFASDRTVGEQIIAAMPQIVDGARANRAFIRRAVTFLAGEAGVRQFLDIGTGIPTAGNTHSVAQSVAPDSRIVYVDNDPIVLAHARALLVGDPAGATSYVDADLRDPDAILRQAAETLDFDRPTAVMLMGVLEFVPDDAQVADIVERLLGALPGGSCLAISHSSNVVDPHGMDEAARLWNEGGSTPLVLRTPDQLAKFFTGLDLVDPGIVSCPLWRPDGIAEGIAPVDALAGIGRRP